jgi:two-component system chemotaxis response regulator CheY
MNVVIADDDAVAVKMLKAILESNNDVVVVGVAEDGHQAIEECKKHVPDVICLDVNMPGMTGTEAIPGIIEVSKDIKIIMISGCATMNLINSSIKAGASDFIIKPFDFEKVTAIVTEM